MRFRPSPSAVLVTVLSSLVLATPAPAEQLTGAPVETQLTAPAAHVGPTGRSALSGPWVVRGDRKATGTGPSKRWYDGAFAGRVVSLPYSPNAGSVTGKRGQRSYRGSIAWYRTVVKVPETGTYALRFESVHHDASVWLDGRKIAEHRGVYLPFERVVGLQAGRAHTLVVRADYRGPTRQKRAGWHRTWFNFGGINREITIRPVGLSEVHDAEVVTRLADGGAAEVKVAARVRNRAAEPRDLTLVGVLRRGTETVQIPFTAQRVPSGESARVVATVVVPEPALWQPGSPELYDLDLAVPGESAYTARVGLRDLRRSGSRMLLNGKVLRLHGASIHEDVKGRGDALTPEDMDGIVRGLQAIGANATRSQHPLSPALLERLDAAGITVWLGLGPVDSPGNWTSRTPFQQRRARERVRETYQQSAAHPSIIAWNLANEIAGNGRREGQIDYVIDTARWLKDRDQGRLTAVDVWGAKPPREGQLGPIYDNLDAIAVTNYMGWYEKPLEPRATVAQAIRAKRDDFLRTFPNKVTVISEFGAEANDMNPAQRPGGYAFQVRFLRQHINAYREVRGLSGMLIWNLRDFAVAPTFAGGSISRQVPGIRLVRGVNQKGLFDFLNRPKPSVGAVAQEYRSLGSGLAP
ncbi:MAG TPA: glycoside hydrolase family 2 TIM barrel-domain containing protein [Baekduia sp.]|nr:glycoside hydrolase family 2 TIM barrel-domain containing protein [Baekduia sp.]